MIVDLLSPFSYSVNHGIPEDRCSLQYTSMDDAMRLIRSLGPGCHLLKMDLKDAYRIVPIHPDDQHLLGISWDRGGVCGSLIAFWAVISTKTVHSSGGCNGLGSLHHRDKICAALFG